LLSGQGRIGRFHRHGGVSLKAGFRIWKGFSSNLLDARTCGTNRFMAVLWQQFESGSRDGNWGDG